MKPLFLTLLLAATLPAFAMMSLEGVTPDRAKQLGITVTATPAGPELVRVTVDFDTAGDLKPYFRSDLEMHDAGKLLVTSSLRNESTKPNHVTVSFALARSHLQQFTLRIVTGQPMDLSGHDLAMKDFVDLTKLR